LAPAAKADIGLGDRLRELFTQIPGETYSLMAQQLMLDVILQADIKLPLNIPLLKRQAPHMASLVKADSDYEVVRVQLTEQVHSGQEPAR